MKLDPIDIRILDAIQRDGRITKLALAERVGPIAGYHGRVAKRTSTASNTLFAQRRKIGAC